MTTERRNAGNQPASPQTPAGRALPRFTDIEEVAASAGLTNDQALDVVLDAFFDTRGPHSLDAFRRDLHTILDAERATHLRWVALTYGPDTSDSVLLYKGQHRKLEAAWYALATVAQYDEWAAARLREIQASEDGVIEGAHSVERAAKYAPVGDPARRGEDEVTGR